VVRAALLVPLHNSAVPFPLQGQVEYRTIRCEGEADSDPGLTAGVMGRCQRIFGPQAHAGWVVCAGSFHAAGVDEHTRDAGTGLHHRCLRLHRAGARLLHELAAAVGCEGRHLSERAGKNSPVSLPAPSLPRRRLARAVLPLRRHAVPVLAIDRAVDSGGSAVRGVPGGCGGVHPVRADRGLEKGGREQHPRPAEERFCGSHVGLLQLRRDVTGLGKQRGEEQGVAGDERGGLTAVTAGQGVPGQPWRETVAEVNSFIFTVERSEGESIKV